METFTGRAQHVVRAVVGSAIDLYHALQHSLTSSQFPVAQHTFTISYRTRQSKWFFFCLQIEMVGRMIDS